MVTTFGANESRQTSFQAKGFGAASLPAQSVEHIKLEKQFRSVVRFAVVHSGQDLESLLRGKFREILQLVISDHLGNEIAKAEAARDEYLRYLQTQLLAPLRGLIQQRVGEMFPEISNAELLPAVPTVYDTLSSVEIRLGDAVTTPLSAKGTGVRGAVLISMLQYLAEQSKRSLVLAVEEPEAFLHPAGQEDIRDQLEELATRKDVSLVVTTHSPYVISRSKTSRVTELRKRADGFTEKAATVRGNENRAHLLGALYRDAGLAHVLERSLEIPPGTDVVAVTEGYTDGHFIRQCCTAANRQDLVETIHFIPAGSASSVVPQAILAAAATEVPVIAVLDFDDNGRAAAAKLKSFNWGNQKNILTLNRWDNACNKQHDIEIEDLLPRQAVEQLVAQLGEDVSLDRKEKCGTGWHFRLSKTWKEQAISQLTDYLDGDPGGMVWLAGEIHARAAKIAASTRRNSLDARTG
ncbi:ATP-dependent nuclease [Gordonia paraffinivorans]|nr:AAA family ATPase [Gordonia paraffinivorans]